jgi:hypothetical protein
MATCKIAVKSSAILPMDIKRQRKGIMAPYKKWHICASKNAVLGISLYERHWPDPDDAVLVLIQSHPETMDRLCGPAG